MARNNSTEALPNAQIHGVANDVGRLMNVLRNRATYVSRTMAWEQVAMGVAEIQEIARCAASIANELKEDSSAARSIEVGAALKQAQTLLRTIAGSTTTIEYQLSANDAQVNISAPAVEQIMLNLIANATAAGASVVTIMTKVSTATLSETHKTAKAARITIKVDDNGHGIDQHAVLRAELHRAEGATPDWYGTGLRTVDSLVRAAAGDLVIAANAAAGASVFVTLPLCTRDISQRPSANEAQTEQTSTQRRFGKGHYAALHSHLLRQAA